MRRAAQFVNRIREIEFPVLKLEMRVRQRKARPFIVMGVYAGILSVATLAVVFASGVSGWHWWSHWTYDDPALTGRLIFRMMSYAQMALVCLIAPAYSAGAIATERERHSIDMLAGTLLSTSAIVMQKLAGAMTEIVILLVTSVPVLAVVFMLGGVSPSEVVVLYTLLLSVAVLLNAAGVFWSSVLANARSSTFASYASAMGYLVVIPVLSAVADGLVHDWYMDLLVGCVTAYLAVALLAGGTAALIVYGIAARRLRRLDLWRTRAVRMGALGLAFAGVLELFSLVDLTKIIVDSSPSFFELPTYVNPFTPLTMFDPYGQQDVWLCYILVLGIAATGTYLLQRAAIAKLDIIRTS